MFRIVLSLIGLVAVPVLLYLAWSGWIRRLRAQLPPWRNALCVSALVLLLLNWLCAVVLEAPVFVSPRMRRPTGLMEAMLTLSHPLGVVVVALAFAFRSGPRVQVALAGLLMLASRPLGYV